MTARQTQRIIDSALSPADSRLRAAVMEVATDKGMSDVMSLTMGQMESFTSPAAAIFAGVALNPQARRDIDLVLDSMWAANGRKLKAAALKELAPYRQDVVIGSGPHAATYAAAKIASGGARPLVLEKEARAGGIMAITRGPAFYLNSRNRPGEVGPPNVAGRALNVLPAAPVQAADLGGGEYQSNDQLAFAVRMTLAMNADVATGVEVEDIRLSSGNAGVLPNDNFPVNAVISYGGRAMATGIGGDFAGVAARYVIIATGIGKPRDLRRPYDLDTDVPVINFVEFMRKLDEPVPFKGFGRTAVIGAGDGGKTVIEALIGQGPRAPQMVPALATPTAIEWYGVPGDGEREIFDEDGDSVQTERTPSQRFRPGWEQCNRSRYAGIGRALPRDASDDTAQVRAYGRAGSIVGGFNQVFVDGRPYDTVIDCTGYESQPGQLTADYLGEPLSYTSNGRTLTRGITGRNVALVGPAAALPLESYERRTLTNIGENVVAIWRYADRTAEVAQRVARGQQF